MFHRFQFFFQLLTDAFAFSRLDTGSFFHHDIGIHLDQAALRIIDETRIASLFDQTFAGSIVQADVQDGFHHARHRGASARTDRNQQWIFAVAEFRAHRGFGFTQSVLDLLFEFCGIVLVVFIIRGANFRCNRKPSRNRQPDVDHFRQVCALAAEQILHVSLTFGLTAAKKIDPFSHAKPPHTACQLIFEDSPESS